MQTPRPGGEDGVTSLTLLDRLRADEGGAWGRVIRLYEPLVRYWAGRRGVVGADADDVTQDVFQAAATNMSGFRRDRPGDTFRGWLRGITRFVVLRHVEKRARQPRASGGTEGQLQINALPEADPDSQGDSDPPAETSALYRRALDLVKNEFEARTWTMFWDHVVGGRTPADVAAEMGVSSAAVRQAKSRVLRRLREELGDLID